MGGHDNAFTIAFDTAGRTVRARTRRVQVQVYRCGRINGSTCEKLAAARSGGSFLLLGAAPSDARRSSFDKARRRTRASITRPRPRLIARRALILSRVGNSLPASAASTVSAYLQWDTVGVCILHTKPHTHTHTQDSQPERRINFPVLLVRLNVGDFSGTLRADGSSLINSCKFESC